MTRAAFTSPWRPPIRAISKQMQQKLKEYERIKRQWKKGKTCAFPECCNNKVDVHHTRGRAGDLLLDARYWLPLCRAHHDWVGRWPDEARRMGLLAKFGQWGKAD